jgi:hypothetical protein
MSLLLDNLETVLRDNAADSTGLPLFAVESRLNEKLRTVLPCVQFMPEDIRSWATQISS